MNIKSFLAPAVGGLGFVGADWVKPKVANFIAQSAPSAGAYLGVINNAAVIALGSVLRKQSGHLASAGVGMQVNGFAQLIQMGMARYTGRTF